MTTAMKSIDVNLVLGRPGTHPWGVETARELLEMMDRYSVERGLVSHIASSLQDPETGNRLLFERLDTVLAVMPAARDRLRGVPAVRLREFPPPERWGAWASRGVACVRVCPRFYREQTISDEAAARLREALERHGLFLHIALAPFYGSPWVSAEVSDAARYASAVDPVPVVLSGIGRGHFTDVEALLDSHTNAVLDVGNLSTATGVQDLVAAGFEDRLVCGSGYGVSYARQSFDVVAASGVSDEVVVKIIYRNAARLLGG